MRNAYSFSELIKTILSLITTKFFYPNARLIRDPVYIRGRKSIKGGNRLTTGRFCRFDLDGSKETLFIGDNCEMGDMTHIVAHEQVCIGNNVLIASKCFISDTNHGTYIGDDQSAPEIPPNKRELVTEPVKIGNNVWIGENVVILAGTEIGDGCVIGANSVVKKLIPSNSIVAGAPAKIIKKWNKNEKKWEKA